MTSNGQVTGIVLYRNDVVVRREGGLGPTDPPIRGDITEFTKASRKRLAFVASNTSVVFTSMITLTYPKLFPRDGKSVKKNLRNFLDWLRRDQTNPEYLWFLEFQARGAPHIHILTDMYWPTVRSTVRELRWRVNATWYRVVGTGDLKHLQAGTRTEKLRSEVGGRHYAVKYAMKMRQKWVPEGYRDCGRFWGHSRGVKPKPLATYRCTQDDIKAAIEKWRYYRGDDFPVYRILYNQADYFDSYIHGTIDLGEFPEYNGTKSHKQNETQADRDKEDF